jgi:hypothetical protein
MKLTKQQLKQIIKEELSEVLSEDIDPDDYYVISGENIIELRKIANELSMKEPLVTTAEYIRTLVSEPSNVRAFEVDEDGKFRYKK